MRIPHNRIPNNRLKFKDALAPWIRQQNAAIWTNVSKAVFKCLSLLFSSLLVCLSVCLSHTPPSNAALDQEMRPPEGVLKFVWRISVNFTSELVLGAPTEKFPHFLCLLPSLCGTLKAITQVSPGAVKKTKKSLPFFLPLESAGL